MNRAIRYLVFLVGLGLLAPLFVWGVYGMPSFGSSYHPYRDRAVHAGVSHEAPNMVSSVNFDQRALDTLGEETIFFGSVIGAAALLRRARDDDGDGDGETRRQHAGRTMESTRFAGYVLLPLTMLVGFDVVAHGHITPGGGFQGGVVLATGLHLLYVAGSYDALDRVSSTELFEYGEITGALGFAGIGIAGIAFAGSFLANSLPFGSFGDFVSAGTVEVLNFAVGIEVSCGVMVLLAQFFKQAMRRGGGSTGEAA